MSRPLFTPGKETVPIVQEAGWAPGPVWTGAENLASTGIRSPDRPARSQSLYRLTYPAHNLKHKGMLKFITLYNCFSLWFMLLVSRNFAYDRAWWCHLGSLPRMYV